MTGALARLREARQRAARIRRGVELRPLDYFQWLPPQHAFFSCPDRVKLFRAGNQALGKTTSGLAEVLWRCTGTHPFLTVPSRGIEAWVICASWSQSLAIQQKLWDLAPKDLVHPETEFDPVKGFRGKNPALRIRAADGSWSIIRIKTTNQGGLMLAGASIDVAMFDEPPKSARIFGEVLKRVMKANGVVLLTLTPVNAPTEWLQELTVPREDGTPPLVTDIHYKLTPDVLIPMGSDEPLRLRDGTPCDEAWIRQIIRETLPHEVPVVVHGEWEMRVEDGVFRAFRASGPSTGPHHSHVIEALPAGTYDLRLGVDYGHGGNFEQVAVLVAVRRDPKTKQDRVYIVDEYVSDRETTQDDDARAILDMLDRNGLTWSSLDRAYGDRPYGGKGGAKVGGKSNKGLEAALVKLDAAKRREALEPRIRTVKRGRGHGAGSVHVGAEYLHRAMVREGHFRIMRRCSRGIESLSKWDWTDSEWKHWIDALRYALDDRIFGGRTRQKAAPVFVY